MAAKAPRFKTRAQRAAAYNIVMTLHNNFHYSSFQNYSISRFFVKHTKISLEV